MPQSIFFRCERAKNIASPLNKFDLWLSKSYSSCSASRCGTITLLLNYSRNEEKHEFSQFRWWDLSVASNRHQQLRCCIICVTVPSIHDPFSFWLDETASFLIAFVISLLFLQHKAGGFFSIEVLNAPGCILLSVLCSKCVISAVFYVSHVSLSNMTLQRPVAETCGSTLICSRGRYISPA